VCREFAPLEVEDDEDELAGKLNDIELYGGRCTAQTHTETGREREEAGHTGIHTQAWT
jgi:hypothetical protein